MIFNFFSKSWCAHAHFFPEFSTNMVRYFLPEDFAGRTCFLQVANGMLRLEQSGIKWNCVKE